jgi:hypothetical protein
MSVLTHRHLGKETTEDGGNIVGVVWQGLPLDIFSKLLVSTREPINTICCLLTLGPRSKIACNSRILFAEPEMRKVPSTSVPFSFR